MSPPLTSQALLPQVAAADPSAMEQCLQVYGPLVWSLAKRILRNDALAEDAVQEIFIQLWKSADRFDASVASETTWITTIARRRLIDIRRRRSVLPPNEDIEFHQVSVEDPGLERAMIDEQAEVARRAVLTLQPDQQKLISLSIFEGLSHSQIAKHTGLPLGTVKTKLRAALGNLRSILGTGATMELGGELS